MNSLLCSIMSHNLYVIFNKGTLQQTEMLWHNVVFDYGITWGWS